jgi:hypothetical protein
MSRYFFVGDCASRLHLADYAALSQLVGGYRLFGNMDVRAVGYDAGLGNGSFVAFSERLVLEAKSYANIFVALRSCAQPLPLPMSLQASTLDK